MLLWLVSIIAVGMGVFGPLAILWVPIAVVPTLCCIIRGSRLRFFELAALWGILLLIAYPLIPRIARGFGPAFNTGSLQRIEAVNDELKSLRSASSEYLPMNLLDDSGTPLHSWRVKIATKFLGRFQTENLDVSKPWNEPLVNLPSYRRSYFPTFQGFKHLSEVKTNPSSTFKAVVGEQAAWKTDRVTQVSDFTDDPANTIILIEVLNSKHPWYEPRDLTIEEAIDLLTDPANYQYSADRIDNHFFTSTIRRVNNYTPYVLTADGTPRQLKCFTSRELARAALTASGGEEIDLSSEEFTVGSELEIITRYNWDKILGTLAFISLAIAPLLFGNKTNKQDTAEGQEAE